MYLVACLYLLKARNLHKLKYFQSYRDRPTIRVMWTMIEPFTSESIEPKSLIGWSCSDTFLNGCSIWWWSDNPIRIVDQSVAIKQLRRELYSSTLNAKKSLIFGFSSCSRQLWMPEKLYLVELHKWHVFCMMKTLTTKFNFVYFIQKQQDLNIYGSITPK